MRRDPVRPQLSSETGSGSELGATIAVERLEAFLRQLSHDVRNDLNAMDLLTSYVEDLQPEGSVREALAQLHDSVRYGSHRMQRLSKAVQVCDPDSIPYPSDLLKMCARATSWTGRRVLSGQGGSALERGWLWLWIRGW